MYNIVCTETALDVEIDRRSTAARQYVDDRRHRFETSYVHNIRYVLFIYKSQATISHGQRGVRLQERLIKTCTLYVGDWVHEGHDDLPTYYDG